MGLSNSHPFHSTIFSVFFKAFWTSIYSDFAMFEWHFWGKWSEHVWTFWTSHFRTGKRPASSWSMPSWICKSRTPSELDLAPGTREYVENTLGVSNDVGKRLGNCMKIGCLYKSTATSWFSLFCSIHFGGYPFQTCPCLFGWRAPLKNWKLLNLEKPVWDHSTIQLPSLARNDRWMSRRRRVNNMERAWHHRGRQWGGSNIRDTGIPLKSIFTYWNSLFGYNQIVMAVALTQAIEFLKFETDPIQLVGLMFQALL